MSNLLLIAAVTAILIAFNALYVAAEFSTVSARRTKLRQEADAGNRFARMLMPIMEDTHRLDTYVAACQLGITASSLVLGYYGQSAIAEAITPLFVGFSGEIAAQSISAVLVLVLLTILQVVLGELVPKSVALRYPEQTALLTIVPLRWSMLLFRPFIALFNGTGSLILRALGVPPSGGHAHIHSPEELELLVSESAKGGLIESDERELLENAFHINEQTAGDLMVPRTQLSAAPLDTAVADLLALATRKGFSRIPLYRDSIDDIAGIVHIRDLYRLHVAGQTDARTALRSVPLVPETKSAAEVWNQLRTDNSYVAMVFDEYGGTAGMITVEDLIEAVFGDVEDEFDAEPLTIAGVNGDRVTIAGDTPIHEANHRFDMNIPDESVRTVAGAILATLGRMPRVGEEVELGTTWLRVEELENNAIRLLSMPRTPARSEEAKDA